MSASKHNSDKDSFALFRARKGSLWVGSEHKDTVREEDEDEKPSPPPLHRPSPVSKPTKSIMKVEKIREKFEVLKPPSTVTSSSSVAASSTKSSTHQDMETEESVSSKLEQWKRRRIERLER